MPKISVIIPCYNVERYIDRCLASIACQTMGMDNLEIIIIDDASTDSTWEHLRIWEQRYPDNILLVRQEVNRRQGAARNIGLAYASAQWVAFVDADDWLEPDYFELLYSGAMSYPCEVVCCRAGRDSSETLVYFEQETRQEDEDLFVFPDEEELRKETIISKFMAGVWGMIVQKSLLIDLDIVFPEDVTYEDMYWQSLVRIYASGIYILGKRLYHYYVNSSSTVLTKNGEHHTDWLTVWMRLWEAYDRRGLLSKYRAELEYDCMENAVRFVKLLILRYDNPSFSLFQLTREILRERVPEYKDNPYSGRLTGVYRVFLEKLYQEPFTRRDFQQLVEYAKNQWSIS